MRVLNTEMVSPESSRTMRFAVMSESLIFKSWEAKCIKEILSLGNIELALFIHPHKGLKKARHLLSINTEDSGGLSKLAFNCYEKLFVKPRCYAQADCQEKYKAIPSIICSPIEDKDHSQYFGEADIQKIKKIDLDFILLFSGFRNLKGEILKSARYGIWIYHYGGLEKPVCKLPYFREIVNNEYIAEISLLKITSKPFVFVPLRRGFLNLTRNSYNQAVDHVYSQSLSWAKEICQNILRNNDKCLDASPIELGGIVYQEPNNRQVLGFCFRLIREKISKLIKDIFFLEQWNIGYIDASIDKIINGNRNFKINWLLSPSASDSFADPFIVKIENKLYLFFENHRFPDKNANISVVAFEKYTKAREIIISLRKPFHLSFPFIFKQGDDIFMIPEAWQTKKIALFKSVGFPLCWKEVAVLLENVSAVDPVLFRYNDLYWLTFTSREQGSDVKLFIFYAQNLTGPWYPHKKNPVKSDVRSSRSAGSVFEHQGVLVRPAQDCSKAYGWRISLNKIKRLTPEEFDEEPLGFVEPNPEEKFNKGVHTINAIDDRVFLDGKRYKFKMNKIFLIQKKLRTDQKFFLYEKFLIKYRFIDQPKFIELKEYSEAIREILNILKKEKGIVSIFQMGHINHPGISDIDLIVVFEDNFKSDFNLKNHVSSKQYLFPHSLGGTSRSHFQKVHNYAFFHNMKLLWGEDLKHEPDGLSPNEANIIKTQIALEYLLENYINLTIQQKYRVYKLRSIFQNIKAIKYDLEFLNISSGDMHGMLLQLHDWLNFWFESPLGPSELLNWINIFCKELEITLGTLIKQTPLYVPSWANLKLSKNISIEFNDSLSHQITGFSLPSLLVGVSKRTFNLNMRMNSFKFQVPIDFSPRNKILEERFVFFKEIKEYGSRYLPYFLPLVSSLANKML